MLVWYVHGWKVKIIYGVLVEKATFKKTPERKSISSPYSFSVIFNTKYIVKGGGGRQLQTLGIYNCNFINSVKSFLLKFC